jgi:hypothetical protein
VFIARVTDLPATLAEDLQITPDVILDDHGSNIHFAHRRTTTADYYFFTSSSSQPFDARVSFGHDTSRTPYIFNLRTGEVTAASVYRTDGARTSLPMRLEPGGAVLVGFEPAGPSTPPHIEDTDLPFVTRGDDGSLLVASQFAGSYFVTQNGETFNISLGDTTLRPIYVPVWDLALVRWTPDGNLPSQTIPSVQLTDLSKLPQLNGFKGGAVYGAGVQVGPTHLHPSVRLVLSLGAVHDAADVRVNGQLVTTLTHAPFAVDVTRHLRLGENRLEIAVTTMGAPSGLLGPVGLIPMYQVSLSALPPVTLPPVPFSVATTPANLPDPTAEDIVAAIARASQITNRVNFQWIWRAPPTPTRPEGGAVNTCADITQWVAEAKSRNLGVILQFQTFVTQLTAPNTPPVVRVANPVVPFAEGTFANQELVDAYLSEIGCLAALEPDYLVLGPEVNFVVAYDFEEFEHFVRVYRRAYDIVKTVSPATQVGMSWQYDGLRDSYALDPWGYIPEAGPQDFIGLTSYFGYSEHRLGEFPTVMSIPADYYAPIRERFGPDVPILFTELGHSSHFANGLDEQVQFLRRLPALMKNVRPIGIVWPLLNDVAFFDGPINGLNDSGLIAVGGELKPSWHTVMEMRADGRLVGVEPRIFAPTPMPFAVNASPPAFPRVQSDDLNMQAIASAASLSGHVSLTFKWRDHVTNQVWRCADIRRYTDEAARRGLRYTLQFHTYATLPPDGSGGSVRVVHLNPFVAPGPSSDGGSIGDPDIRQAYLQEIECLAGLGADYLVLGPEVNVLLAIRPDEFSHFISAYQAAYDLAKGIAPSMQVGVSYQYDAIRHALQQNRLPSYIQTVGRQDYVGFSSYFNYSDDAYQEYPSVISVPFNYYSPIRSLVGPNTPVVFTDIGWPSHYEGGEASQVQFLNRLPTLLQSVKPANVIWALQYDLDGYFSGQIQPLNSLGLAGNDATPKSAWRRALRLMQMRVFTSAPPLATP